MLHILSCAAYAQTSANPGVILTNGAKFYASCVKEDAVFKYRGEPANGKTIAYLGPLRDCNDIVDLSEPCVSTDPYHPGLFSCTFEAAGNTIERTAVTANRYESAIDGGAPGVGVACEMPVEGDITGDGTITLKIGHRVQGRNANSDPVRRRPRRQHLPHRRPHATPVAAAAAAAVH